MPERDPSTLSNYQAFQFGKTDVSVSVDFTKKVVSGTVVFRLTAVAETSSIDLDTSFLDIHEVSVDGTIVEYTVKDRHVNLGSQLQVATAMKIGQSVELKIAFSTTDQCTALQFLDKEATDGKKLPYLFSQCQAIHARSLFPCFDTPAVKTPYGFKVNSPLPSKMSGRPQAREEGDGEYVYRFDQPIPMPSYLVALASGDITGLPIGPRSHVYSEPVNVSACQHEFEDDMEKFLQAAESIVFPYEWDQYDALVLPKSFPYGGMENPNATFVTPTLISGDRQNIDVIAHELAHSWSGNLVTNCSWEHFWLNEGWTVYLERRIQAAIHSEAARHFSAIIGWADLENSIKAMGSGASRFSRLVQDLKDGTDPDDAFSTVPYEKGFNLLFHIEQKLGKSAFDKFIPHYFSKFKYQSLDTKEFLDTLYGFFPEQKEILDSIDWNSWLHNPGMPPIKPHFDTSLADQCYELADRWFKALSEKSNRLSDIFSKNDIVSFNANQSVVFLETLASFNKNPNFEWCHHVSALQEMDTLYHSYSTLSNAEVMFRWFVLHVTGENTVYYDKLGQWLGTVGRMKFVRPGYTLLNRVDRDLAVKYFRRFESSYHPICRALVKKDLSL